MLVQGRTSSYAITLRLAAGSFKRASLLVAIPPALMALLSIIPFVLPPGAPAANAVVSARKGLILDMDTHLHGKFDVMVTPLKAKVIFPTLGYTYVCDGKTGSVTIFCDRTRTKLVSSVNKFEPVGMEAQSLIEGSQHHTA